MVAVSFSTLTVLLLSAASSLSLAAPTAADTEVLEPQVYDPTALVKRENPAVAYTSWSSSRTCGGSSNGYTTSDGGCFSLPGQSITVNSIAATCRTFIYGNRDCTGTEIQVYPGTCYDTRTFYTMKTFCH
ncbi:hypothetical protein QBC43DRAFT_352498 [Cladorrhinum sp. PSN259]|nr:hypothetical protein QBC43DRAFT_352498 [Cladorrhinum sp. PSN259]